MANKKRTQQCICLVRAKLQFAASRRKVFGFAYNVVRRDPLITVSFGGVLSFNVTNRSTTFWLTPRSSK